MWQKRKPYVLRRVSHFWGCSEYAIGMNEAVLHTPAQPLGTVDDLRQSLRKSRNQLKGRQADPAALLQVRNLIGPRPADGYRRDLLIEHLHALNDHYRALFERHLVALAQEMNIPMAEVFEVASFYHHFEILKDDATAPALTIRVCDGLACEMAGAQGILTRLPALLGNPDIRRGRALPGPLRTGAGGQRAPEPGDPRHGARNSLPGRCSYEESAYSPRII